MKTRFSILSSVAFLIFSFVGLSISSCTKDAALVTNQPQTQESNLSELSDNDLLLRSCGSRYSNDVAVQWIQLQQRLYKTTAGINVLRISGYTGVAMYEALLPSLTNYHSLAQQIGLTGLPTAQRHATYHGAASVNAAMAQTCRNFFATTSAANKTSIDSLEAVFKDKFQSDISATGFQRSVDFGKQVANTIFEWASTDGSLTVNPPYVPPVGAGLWVPTPPAFAPPVNTYLGNNRTFISGLVNKIRITPPPVTYSTDPNSAYYKEVKKVYDISQNLSPEQITIAKTWADFGAYYNVPGTHYINIVTQFVVNYHLTLDDAAVLYAKSGIAASDAITLCFKIKYQRPLMRPITYIRGVMGQTAWNTVVPTPPHPEYPTAHVMNGQPIIEVLKYRFGNRTTFVDRSNEALYGARTYRTLDAIVKEAAYSRVLAGIHYQSTGDASIPMGAQVGRLVNRLVFKREEHR